ncbi:uncharacterized protein [Arachis hypogaea]|uniref:uncharacterized protein isoform X1 n=1 Tax=Arachis hypogaea TaxID=3818 RepID=UPI000DEC1D58
MISQIISIDNVLKRYMEMRGADGGTSDMLCALPAFWAARALANLAAHGDSNSNNAVVGQEAGKKLLVPFGTCHLMIETGKPS